MGKFDGIIIVSDIDGTFLGKNSRMVPENLEAIEYFKAEGGCFTIATGREVFSIPRVIPMVKELCNIPIIACNGAFIYDFQKEQIVVEEFLPEPEISGIVDAVRDLYLPFPIMPIIKGDATSYHVAAASIVAKVTRDRQMAEYAKLYPQYGFDHNMGYGTAEHIEALKKYGPTPEHRRSFITKFL